MGGSRSAGSTASLSLSLSLSLSSWWGRFFVHEVYMCVRLRVRVFWRKSLIMQPWDGPGATCTSRYRALNRSWSSLSSTNRVSIVPIVAVIVMVVMIVMVIIIVIILWIVRCYSKCECRLRLIGFLLWSRMMRSLIPCFCLFENRVVHTIRGILPLLFCWRSSGGLHRCEWEISIHQV